MTKPNFAMFRSPFIAGAAAILSIFLGVASALGQDSPIDSKQVEKWIAELASDQFDTRQAAMNSLVGEGETILPMLQESLKGTMPAEQEVRIRALILRIEEQVLHNRLDAFIRDSNPENDYGMKAWPFFREIVGENRVAKKMMVEVYRTHPELADLAASKDPNLPQAAAKEAEAIRSRFFSGQPLELGDGIGLLFVGSLSEQPLPPEVEAVAIRAIYFAPLAQKMDPREWQRPMSRLINRWLPHLGTSNAYDGLELAMRYGLDAGENLARRTLQDPNAGAEDLAAATNALMRFGKAEDIPILEPLLSNETVLEVSTMVVNGSIVPFQSNLQDLALAAILHLQGKPVSETFVFVRPDPLRIYDVRTIGFAQANPADRKAAFEKFRKESAK